MLKRQQEYLGQALVRAAMESYPKFQNEVGAPIVRIGSREFTCIGDKPPQDHPHIYLNWEMLARSSAPIALRYSVSIRPWAHAKLIRQIVLTLTRTELKSSNAASLVMLPEADHRQTTIIPSPTVGDLSGYRNLRRMVRHLRRALRGHAVFR